MTKDTGSATTKYPGRAERSAQVLAALAASKPPEQITAAPPSELRMVVVFRADLPLPPGKMAVQAGHAFLSAFRAASPDIVAAYDIQSQAKIVMIAPDFATLERIQAKAKARGVSAVIITDAARTVLPHPTETVLGMGPMTRTDSNALTRGLELMP